MADEKFDCPGHEGECEFCKSKYGSPRSVSDMPEIDRLTGERLVDPCCKPCANNLRRSSSKQFNKTSIS
jgi:hypothetical protein